jgi:hypothetical protein
MPGALMAKAKGQGGRSPKNKERKEPGFRTVGIRVSNAYADWLTNASKFDRMTIAAFIDKAVTERARAIGFSEPPPERIP